MSVTHTEASNLFPFLVAEEQHHDHQAEEALFLTFNVDLGYFEARLLGLLRATGARVTVVADAGVWAPDVRAVKHAGRSYQVGLIDQPTAFHPKLMVLVGSKRAVAAVGSGNLTMGGWQYNRELLTVFTGDVDGMPTAFADIRELLNSLGATGDLDAVTAERVGRTIRHLDQLIGVAPAVDTGHRVHASWDGPLIEHLPTEPVAELYLSAAFHDPNANAVRALLKRLSPRKVEVAVQPGWTHLDPAELDRVLTAYAAKTGAEVSLLADPESMGSKHGRYRHGKLIEWVDAAGVRHALTGSPNLSTVALLRRAGDHDGVRGNHELAVIGPVETSLFPGGTPVAASDVPALRVEDDSPSSDADAVPVVRVLSAVVGEVGLTVRFNRAATSGPVTVEVSHRSDHPDQWTTVGEVPVGESAVTYDLQVPPASRVRTNHPELGPTAPMFATDPQRVRMQAIPPQQASKTQRSMADDLFGSDLDLLSALQGDLTAFAQDVSNARGPVMGRDSEHDRVEGDRQRGGDAVEPWLWMQDDTVRRFGPGLASWLLALPRLNAADTGGVPWLDIINDDQTAGLDADEEASDVDESLTQGEVEAATTDLIDHGLDADKLKAARRRWASRATEAASGLSLPSRLLILRVTLAFWTAGNWTDGSAEPFTLVRDLVRGLDPDGFPDEVRDRSASLAAVALTVMRQHTDITVGTEQTHRFIDARDAAAGFLDAATDDTITAYVAGLRTESGGALTTGHVADTLLDLMSEDPLSDLHRAMEDAGHEVHRPTLTSMHIVTSTGTPAVIASEAVGVAAQSVDSAAVWVTKGHDWAVVGWQKPDLVTVAPMGQSERWRHQRLTGIVTPASAATMFKNALRSNEGTGGLPGVVLPRHKKTPAAEAVLASLDVASVREPLCCADTEDET